MRKITSKQDEEKKARRNRIILSLFLVFIMFFSVIEYSFLSNPSTQNTNNQTNSATYNGFKFTPQNGYWILNKDGTNFIFRYNPNQISAINLNASKLDAYQNKILYIKTGNLEAESEIRTNLAVFTSGVIITDNENCKDNTIIIESKNESKIYQKENCVYIQGNGSELVKLADEFLFKILNIR